MLSHRPIRATYDRSIDRIFTFDVTFTAVFSGSYSFTIPVLVDGGTMATEQDNIQVGGLLGFPLPGYTPYTAPVSAVMDNSVLERTPIEFYVPGNVIKAFNGEIGERQYGVIPIWIPTAYTGRLTKTAPTPTSSLPPPRACVRSTTSTAHTFPMPAMPGYNYQVPEGTPVLATADGKLYKAVTDPVNGAGYDYYYNSYIDHQNGYVFLVPLRPLDPRHPGGDKPQRVCPGDQGADHRPVTIGADHLHFEVRYNGIDNQNVVDPYKLGLWLPNTAHMEGLLLLLLEDDAPSPSSAISLITSEARRFASAPLSPG